MKNDNLKLGAQGKGKHQDKGKHQGKGKGKYQGKGKRQGKGKGKGKTINYYLSQIALTVLDLAVEMCTRPWIVELSKKSRTIPNNIFWNKIPLVMFM